MEEELTDLENRIEQMVVLCERLKSENRDLSSRVARLEADSHAQSEKLRLAGDKVEGLLARLPAE